MSKTIFVISQYITPHDVPGGKNRYLLARELARRGTEVYVFSSNYSHMLKKNVRKVQGLYSVEKVEGMNFIWINTYSYKKSDWKRAVNIAQFGFKSYKAALELSAKGIRPDIIIGSVAHAFSVGAAYYASKKLHSRFFIEVGDLWPEVFIESGRMTRRNPIYILVKKVMYYYFGKAEKIICITKGAKNYFEKIGFGAKTIVLPFGIIIDDSVLGQSRSEDKDVFRVMYAGSFQPIYPLDNVIKAAKIIEDTSEKKIRFTLLGNGVQRRSLEEMTEGLGLKNVEFHDQVPKGELLEYLKHASAFIIIEKHGRYGFPNKIIDYLSVGRPIIYVSPARHEILNGGFCVEASNNPEDIARSVIEVSSMPYEKRIEMENRANRFLIENHNIEVITQKLIDSI